jgi:predicted phosphodiesterase
MTSRIGLLGDPHADPAPLAEALEVFERQGVDQILCAGDIAGYGDPVDATVDLLIASGCISW